MIDQFRADRADYQRKLSALEIELVSAQAEVDGAAAAVHACIVDRDEVNRLISLMQDKDGTLPSSLYDRYRNDKWASARPDIVALADAREAARVVTVKVARLLNLIEDARDSMERLDRLIAAASPSSKPAIRADAPLPLPTPDPTAGKRKRIKVAA
jgi:hypothetical protein